MKFSAATEHIARPYSVPVEATESLPFRVRLVDDAQDLARAVEIRSAAYARHVPLVGEVLRIPEADDFRTDVLVMIAEQKLDGRVLGSVRMQPNLREPLRIEGEAKLPAGIAGRRLMEFMRLGVENGNAGSLVTTALVKAGYEVCHACGIEFVLVAGRISLGKMYRSMCFDELLDGATVPLSYANHLPHRIFCMPIDDADRRWRDSHHGLYGFMARTEHPDIEIDYARTIRTFGRRR